MTRITDILARLREKAAKRDEGFTLIELLVVVLIIGILAAIAIPVYIGVQNSATDSAVKSDISNLKAAVVATYTTTGTFPTAVDSDDVKDNGYPGPSVDYAAPADEPTISGDENGFCVQATSPAGEKLTFYATDASGVEEGDCPTP